MHSKLISFLVTFMLFSNSNALKSVDTHSLLRILHSDPYSRNLENNFYTARGIHLLQGTVPNETVLCDLTKENVDKHSPKSVFFATGTANMLSDCVLAIDTLPSLNENSFIEDVYHLALAARFSSLSISQENLASKLHELPLDETSAASYAHVLFTASTFPKHLALEFRDVFHQALQKAKDVQQVLSGGISEQALLFCGIFGYAKAIEDFSFFTEENVLYFADYFAFAAEDGVLTTKKAYYLTEALNILSFNEEVGTPVVCKRLSSSNIDADSPDVLIGITNMFQKPMAISHVVAKTMVNLPSGAIVKSEVNLDRKSSDRSVYTFNAYSEDLKPGAYKINLEIFSDRKLIGASQEIRVVVAQDMLVEDVNLFVADKAHSENSKNYRIDQNEAPGNLKLNSNNRITLTFSPFSSYVHESQQPSSRPTLACLKLIGDTGNQVAYFANQLLDSPRYEVTVDLSDKAKDFHHRSGMYEMHLMLGDRFVKNPINLNLGSVQIEFANTNLSDWVQISSFFKPKDEISHIFRPAEKRPPFLISLVFTGALVAPFVLMIILWIVLGFNVSDMPFSLSMVLFHCAHIGSVAIFCYSWLYLNLFDTIKYVSIAYLIMFVFGHRLLRVLAVNRLKH